MKFLSKVVSGMCLAAAISLPALSQEIKIGGLWPLKVIVGEQARRSAQLAVDQINEAGGVLGGKKLKLVVYDDGYDPAQAVSAARRLFSEDKVKILIGGMTTAISMAELQVAQQNDALYMCTACLAPDLTKYPKAFRGNFTYDQNIEALRNFMGEQKGNGKVAFIAENGDYGRLLTSMIKKEFGDKLVDAELYELMAQSDFSTIATRVKSTSPDVIALGFGPTEQGAALIRAIRDAGIKSKIFIMPGSLTPQLVKVTGDIIEGTSSADIWAVTIENPENAKFVKAMALKFKEVPGKLDFLAYEHIVLLAAAMEKAGTADDTTAIANALKTNEFRTPRGTVLLRNGQAATKDAGLTQVVVDGGLLKSRK